jgi:hypothetical protein
MVSGRGRTVEFQLQLFFEKRILKKELMKTREPAINTDSQAF